MAFALVWAEGDEPLTSTDEAFAAASCQRCAVVAVASQVVLVVGEADVAVPQNTAVSVSYDCTSCLTFSAAVQLFVTLDGPRARRPPRRSSGSGRRPSPSVRTSATSRWTRSRPS